MEVNERNSEYFMTMKIAARIFSRRKKQKVRTNGANFLLDKFPLETCILKLCVFISLQTHAKKSVAELKFYSRLFLEEK